MNGSIARNVLVAQLTQMGRWCSSCNVQRDLDADGERATCPKCGRIAYLTALPAEEQATVTAAARTPSALVNLPLAREKAFHHHIAAITPGPDDRSPEG